MPHFTTHKNFSHAPHSATWRGFIILTAPQWGLKIPQGRMAYPSRTDCTSMTTFPRHLVHAQATAHLTNGREEEKKRKRRDQPNRLPTNQPTILSTIHQTPGLPAIPLVNDNPSPKTMSYIVICKQWREWNHPPPCYLLYHYIVILSYCYLLHCYISTLL